MGLKQFVGRVLAGDSRANVFGQSLQKTIIDSSAFEAYRAAVLWLEATATTLILRRPDGSNDDRIELDATATRLFRGGTELLQLTTTALRLFTTTLLLDMNDNRITEVRNVTYKGEIDLGDTGAGTVLVDLALGTSWKATVTGNFALDFTDPAGPGIFFFFFTNDGSVRTPTFASNILANKGLLPYRTQANEKNAYIVYHYGSGNYVMLPMGAQLGPAVQSNP